MISALTDYNQRGKCMTNKSQTIYKSARYTLLLLAAFAGIFALNFYYLDDTRLSRSILNLAAYPFVVMLLNRALKPVYKSFKKHAFIAAALLSVMLVLGKNLYADNNLDGIIGSAEGFLLNLLCLCGFFLLLSAAFCIAFYYLSRVKIGNFELGRFFCGNKRSFFVLWGIIFASWIPCLLAYWPGIYSYDMGGQTLQALGTHPIDRFQTTAHTLFFKLCVKIGFQFGGPNAVVATYSILQMLILSAAFAFVLWYLARIKVNAVVRGLLLAVTALNPMNAIMSITETKDIFFAIFYMLFIVCILDLLRNPQRFFSSFWRMGGTCALVVVACLFRVNAAFALIIFFLVMLVVLRKHYIRILGMAVVSLTVFVLIYGPVYTLFGVEGANGKEMLSVPMQQIASVLSEHQEELSAEEISAIADIIDITTAGERFNPRYADPVKDHFNITNFNADISRYAKLWAGLLTRYPDHYVSAFLTLNLNYWYPDSDFIDKYSERMYIESYVWDYNFFKVERKSVLPGLLESYEKFASGAAPSEIPVFSVVFNIGFPVWFLIIGIIVCHVRKNKRLALCLWPGLLVWFTFMLGPVSNVRYIYYLFALLPVYTVLLLFSDKFIARPTNGEQELRG